MSGVNELVAPAVADVDDILFQGRRRRFEEQVHCIHGERIARIVCGTGHGKSDFPIRAEPKECRCVDSFNVIGIGRMRETA